jgi:pimeloyl-ACP methyl ester carboxylesterase
MTQTTRDVQVNCVDTGGQGTALVWVHGWSCGHDDWSAQIKYFAGAHRCLAVDLPGHGCSASPDQATIEAMAQGLGAALDAAGVDQAVLIGHSMGCRVILQSWKDRPNRVAGMVFVDGSLMEGDLAAIHARFRAEIEANGADKLIDRLYEGFCVDTTPEAVRGALARRREQADPAMLVRLFFDMVRWDIECSLPTLDKLDVPVMVLQSTLLDSTGRRVPIKQGETTPWTRAVRARLPGARMLIVPDVGHFPMMEAPAHTNSLISGFVQSLPARCHHHSGDESCPACQ